MAWVSPQVGGQPPCRRVGHGFASESGNLYVFGGLINDTGEQLITLKLRIFLRDFFFSRRMVVEHGLLACVKVHVEGNIEMNRGYVRVLCTMFKDVKGVRPPHSRQATLKGCVVSESESKEIAYSSLHRRLKLPAFFQFVGLLFIVFPSFSKTSVIS